MIQTINKVTSLVPEMAPMVKKASLEQEFPTGNREETIVSAMELQYMTKLAHVGVDYEVAARVNKAVELYGVRDEISIMSSSMIKSACYREVDSVNQAQNKILNYISDGRPDFEKVAEACATLHDSNPDYEFQDVIKLYAGKALLNKEAAVAALNWRATRTNNPEFTKIATVLGSTNPDSLTIEDNRAIISAVTGLEKEAKYRESNFYTDAFLLKEAAVNVKLCGRTVPAEHIKQAAQHIGDVLGSDIGDALDGDLGIIKQVVEALPIGEKKVIEGIV